MDIAVLGPVELRAGTGEVVPIAGTRLRTLIILLALDAGRTVSADRLIDGIWGDAPPAAAANALQALVSRLRRAAPELRIEAVPTGYRLVIDRAKVDVFRFERSTPGEAVKLWRGDPEFPEAAAAELVRLRRLHLSAQQAWLAAEMAHRDVVPELEALVAAHPLDEPLVALLIRALRANGSPGRALEVFEQARRRLAEQLGTDPSAELTRLHRELLHAQPAAAGTAGSTNLPAELSTFVGRDSEIHTLTSMLRTHRLVTLTGPGGSGKTRLSVEVGARLPGEVWRVELAPVRDPAEVPQTVLSALPYRDHLVLGNHPTLARLRSAVAGRRMLLILDNCEHLIDAAAAVADTLLRAAPGLRLLATSREPLGIPGEILHPVEPLESPPPDAGPAEAAGFPAVRLLLDRAAGFTLTGDNVAHVVRICRALDGMPLAVELAAARLRSLPPAVLADRLADRFRLLTGGSRTALPRHQTLRAVVGWSWDLLTEPERRLWRRLAAFPGGAEVAAVEQVCDADLDLLGALVDKSLLVLGADGRYRMLETIREYGLERLAEAGETEPMRVAIGGWLLARAREAEPHLRGAEQLTWMARLRAEHDNLHAGVRDAIAAGDRATAIALVANLGWYWWLCGHRVEGTGLCLAALALDGPADSQELALAHTLAALNGVEGPLDFAEVRESFRRALELVEPSPDSHPALRLVAPLAALYASPEQSSVIAFGQALYDDPDPWLRAMARMIVGQVRLNFGEPAEVAEADLTAALAGFRAVGERWGIGFTLSALADLTAARGGFARAVGWQREAIALVEAVGVREDLPQLTTKLAHQMWLAGDREAAHRTLERARRQAVDAGVPEVMGSVHHAAATIARAEGRLDDARREIARAVELIVDSTLAPQFRAIAASAQGLIEGAAGDLGAARARHEEALRIAVGTLDSPVIAQVLVGIADLACREGDPARAATLLGAAVAVRGAVDRTVEDADRVEREARAALGDAAFEAAFHQGDGIDQNHLPPDIFGTR
ncbi:putative ATPase/DNA-binding winged helix-turn-helix (wHTH) protein [Actinoplanes octamycinicus]|uniref:Putative ATPase/DNA-binding winged helix-turn-helix (WHTH) protein n=1 Tax=Actinoplanes octamycinicus TaxID=135948 RepID=A0A7W7GWJ3_9ACTN|nr:BTAD domain-containing putative transcriptional regulator [Actinoplanes octamycinicus]MBB4739640.1 putative ATPase/DNA-binding winged helix-turn-helix (wHTH) protein [Actinoplanes octamycinicus]GIE54823.1 SARP family transcriptional regulator [Actinoplanes octamycinicus]